MNSAWITAAATLALVAGALLTFCARWAWRLLSRTRDFLDDWAGQPARPGVPERPGVMKRLAAVEEHVEEIKRETKPNDGHSLRDAINRIAVAVTDTQTGQTGMRGRMEQLEDQRQERDGNHG